MQVDISYRSRRPESVIPGIAESAFDPSLDQIEGNGICCLDEESVSTIPARDRAEQVARIDEENIVPSASQQAVDPFSADENVIAITAVKRVVSRRPEQPHAPAPARTKRVVAVGSQRAGVIRGGKVMRFTRRVLDDPMPTDSPILVPYDEVAPVHLRDRAVRIELEPNAVGGQRASRRRDRRRVKDGAAIDHLHRDRVRRRGRSIVRDLVRINQAITVDVGPVRDILF